MNEVGELYNRSGGDKIENVSCQCANNRQISAETVGWSNKLLSVHYVVQYVDANDSTRQQDGSIKGDRQAAKLGSHRRG